MDIKLTGKLLTVFPNSMIERKKRSLRKTIKLRKFLGKRIILFSLGYWKWFSAEFTKNKITLRE